MTTPSLTSDYNINYFRIERSFGILTFLGYSIIILTFLLVLLLVWKLFNRVFGVLRVDLVFLFSCPFDVLRVWFVNLRPHQHLRRLNVEGYPGEQFSNWLSCVQILSHISLLGFDNCKYLPPLEELPYLKSLSIG
jgi:hypothetical protein